MKIYVLFFIIIGFITALGCKPGPKPLKAKPTHIHRQSIAPVLTPHEISFVKTYQTHLEENIASEGIPGAAFCIVKGPKILTSQGIGRLNIESKEKVDAYSQFRLGSLSKCVTGALVARLVAENIIQWDTKVIDVLPEFALKNPVQTKRVTLAHLLSHSTGLPYHSYTNLIEAGLTMEEILPYFSEVDLFSNEGELCAYQNAAFSVSELIFEKVLKLPIDKIYEQFLFDPIGMCEANTSKEQLVNSKHASPHRINRQSRKAYPRSVSQKYYNAIPCGGINASISDMARFLQLVMGNFPDLLSSKELGFMLSPFVSTPGTRYFDRWSDESSSYGMGWRILKYRGRRLAYHGGFVNNYRTEIAFDLDRKIGICLLFNANSTYAKRAVPLFFDLWESTFIDKNI